MGNRMKAMLGAVLWDVGVTQGLRLARGSLLVTASLAVVSCGGGGGAQSPTGPSFDLAEGIASLSASKVNTTMSISGTLNGFNMTGSAQLTQSVATASTFSGGSALMQTTTVSGTGITSQGGVPLLYSFTQYDSSAYATLGLDTNFNSVPEYVVADAPFEFPSSVKVGDSAVLGTMKVYLDSARTELAGSLQVSYVVMADPANSDSVIVEVIDEYTGSANGGQTYQFDYSLTTTGSMSLQSLSITAPTDTATVDMFQFTVQ